MYVSVLLAFTKDSEAFFLISSEYNVNGPKSQKHSNGRQEISHNCKYFPATNEKKSYKISRFQSGFIVIMIPFSRKQLLMTNFLHLFSYILMRPADNNEEETKKKSNERRNETFSFSKNISNLQIIITISMNVAIPSLFTIEEIAKKFQR